MYNNTQKINNFHLWKNYVGFEVKYSPEYEYLKDETVKQLGFTTLVVI